MARLEGKVAIVTGAGSQAAGIGNGRATAIIFAREGARVLATDLSAASAEETVEMIRKEGLQAEPFVGDVTKADDCRAMVEAAVRRWGRLDVLDNNVGIDPGERSVVTATEEEWDRTMAVNVKSIMLTGKYAVPAMAANGGGAIVNISSISALRPRGLTPYTASKGAVIAVTKGMAVDHAKDHIRVNCVVPGPMFTPMVYAKGYSEEVREKRRLSTLLKVEGTGWDIGYAALFLASEESRFITGIVLVVDGGVSLASPPRGY